MSAIDLDTLYINGIVRNKTAEPLVPETALEKYKTFCNSLLERYPNGKLDRIGAIAAYCLRVLILEPKSEITVDDIFNIH